MSSLALSLRIQDIAQSLDDVLTEIAGHRVSFVFVVEGDGVAQYVSNASRPDGRALLESLIERWDTNRADIPAHYNPDLKGQ